MDNFPITENYLNNEEMLLFLNESSIGNIIEINGRIVSANRAFFEITGRNPQQVEPELMSVFDTESAVLIDEYKSRIIDNIEKDQVIRAEDKRFSVMIFKKNGKKVKCTLDIILLSYEPEQKWGYKLIDCGGLQLEQSQIVKMEKLKDSLLILSQSLIKMKDIQIFYDLVLEAADDIISNGEFCTILKLNKARDTFIPVATRGYSWELKYNFQLPVKDSFSWLELGHFLDQTIILNDVEKLCKKKKVIFAIEGHRLGSSMQTPIYLDDDLYGILTIDSRKKNVFTKADFNIIEYLRTQIQIALENQLLYNQIKHKANYDELTDVASRGAFEEKVIKFLTAKHHYESCCIVMMDLNDLKVVNDIWGHSAGDSYLMQFISVMKQHMRGSDLLARLGGDEFAICFFSSQSAQFIERLEEIQDHFVENPLNFSGKDVSCWFSYGISHCPEDGETYDVLINAADSRMYAMKAMLKDKELKNDLHEYR